MAPLIPLIPIIKALAAGGILVPHAAGGLIVTGAGGYITGTFLSTSAVGWLLGIAGTATLGAVGAAASAVIGSAGIAGTSVGATGLTAKLMALGLISATPIGVPIAFATGAIGAVGGLAFFWSRLRRKASSVAPGQEAQFTSAEAHFVQRLLLSVAKQPAKASLLTYQPAPKDGVDDERSGR